MDLGQRLNFLRDVYVKADGKVSFVKLSDMSIELVGVQFSSAQIRRAVRERQGTVLGTAL